MRKHSNSRACVNPRGLGPSTIARYFSMLLFASFPLFAMVIVSSETSFIYSGLWRMLGLLFDLCLIELCDRVPPTEAVKVETAFVTALAAAAAAVAVATVVGFGTAEDTLVEVDVV